MGARKEKGSIKDEIGLSPIYLETSKMDEKLKNQKTLTLSGLLKLNPLKCRYIEIKPQVAKFERILPVP